MERLRSGVVAGLVIGVVLALPLGVLIGRGATPADPPEQAAPVPPGVEGLRNPYSARVVDDPAFLAAQQANLEALDRQCEEQGEFCAEAAALRRALSGD